MKTKITADLLKEEILALEAKKAEDFMALKGEVNNVIENLKPINLIKNTIKEITHFPSLKEGVGKTAIGMATGFIFKKLVFGSSINPIKKIAGSVVQSLLTNFAANNSDKIKEKSFGAFQFAKSLIMKKRKLLIKFII